MSAHLVILYLNFALALLLIPITLRQSCHVNISQHLIARDKSLIDDSKPELNSNRRSQSVIVNHNRALITL